MRGEELIRLTHAALERCGLSLCEYFVLCAVGYRINLAPAALARQSWGLSEGDPRGAFLLDDHVAAIGRCVEKGWLRVLEPADFDSQGHRVPAGLGALEEEPNFRHFKVGHVDFTAQGYDLWSGIVRALHGDSSTR